MKKLHLSKQLDVPIDIVTEAVAWIGARGSGKTHGAGKLVELLLDAEVPVVVLDPCGTWYGLRLARDGKGRGLAVPVFGGLHGDVPLEPTAGALIADLIVDRNLSAVLDVSQMETDAQRNRFAADFAERFFFRKKKDPAAVHFVIEEAQEFIPQNPQRGEEMMLHRFHRMVKLGRNFGIGVSLITQRPQETSKKVLNQCQTVFAFRLTGPHERKAVKEWIAEHDLDQALAEKLPSLETGTCHVWSPAFMKVSQEIRILPKATLDASATPKFGERRAARELAPIDLERIREAMAATIEKAKAEDPKALQREIAHLRRLVDGKQVVVAATPKVERVEVPVIKAAALKRAENLVAALDKLGARHLEVKDQLITELRGVVAMLQKAVPIRVTYVAPLDQRTVSFAPHSAPRPPRKFLPIDHVNGDVSAPQARILATIVFLERIQGAPADKYQVALFVGVSPTSGSYANNLGALRSAGLIDYPSTGSLAITEAGRAAAPEVQVPTTSAELHGVVLAKLPRPQQALLQEAIAAYPNPVTKDWLAERVGVSATSGSYANNLGHMRTMGVLTYPRTGFVRAADILFIRETAEIAR